MTPHRTRLGKNVTLHDVAKLAGVSSKTVSNVVNNWPYITAETRQRVQEAINTLGYRPSALASSLRTGKSRTIGVMLPDITNPFFGQVVRGCEDVLYAAGYSIFLCNTGEDAIKEGGYLDMLVSRRVDGLVVFGARSSAEVLTSALHDAIPIVAEDSPVQNGNTTVIDIDNSGGACAATTHLIALGHTRIGHLGGPVQRRAADKRAEGYSQALAEAGIPFDPALVYRSAPSIRGGYQSAMQCLKQQAPTALFCYNDLIAIGAMIACRRLELSIPNKVAIVGFDDIALASLVEPALTTVRVRQYDLGRMASALLLDRLRGKETPSSHVIFPVELVVRNSCGGQHLSRKQLGLMLEDLLSSDLADLSSHEAEGADPGLPTS